MEVNYNMNSNRYSYWHRSDLYDQQLLQTTYRERFSCARMSLLLNAHREKSSWWVLMVTRKYITLDGLEFSGSSSNHNPAAAAAAGEIKWADGVSHFPTRGRYTCSLLRDAQPFQSNWFLEEGCSTTSSGRIYFPGSAFQLAPEHVWGINLPSKRCLNAMK